MCDISIVSQKCHKKPVRLLFYYPKVSVKKADRANLQRVLVKTTSNKYAKNAPAERVQSIQPAATEIVDPGVTICGAKYRVTTDRWQHELICLYSYNLYLIGPPREGVYGEGDMTQGMLF